MAGDSEPTSVTSSPSRIQVTPSAITTSQWNRLQGRRSSRAGTSVSNDSPMLMNIRSKGRAARPKRLKAKLGFHAWTPYASSMDAAEILIDARGHRCPVPTLRLRRALEGAPEGARVRLLADDPLARIDVPHFAASIGAEVLE